MDTILKNKLSGARVSGRKKKNRQRRKDPTLKKARKKPVNGRNDAGNK